jgi:hypothetical protein
MSEIAYVAYTVVHTAAQRRWCRVRLSQMPRGWRKKHVRANWSVWTRRV